MLNTTKQHHTLEQPTSFTASDNAHFQQVFTALQPLANKNHVAAKDYNNRYEQLAQTLPQEENKRLYGVIIEWGQPQGGHDLLTVFANSWANYNPCQGQATILEGPDRNFDALIADVLEVGYLLLPNMPAWDASFQQPVASDWMRIHLLTAQGMFSAEAPLEEIAHSPLGEEMTHAARMLMQWLAAYEAEA